MAEQRHELVIKIGKTVGPDQPVGYKPEEPIDPKLAIELAHYLVGGSLEFDIAVGDWYASGRIAETSADKNPAPYASSGPSAPPMRDAPPVFSMRKTHDHGDATAHYDIEIHKTSTVRGWIKEILSKKNEWGYIGIKSDELGAFFGKPNFEYKYGNPLDIPPEFEPFMDMTVKSASYEGGYSRGDWLFEVEK